MQGNSQNFNLSQVTSTIGEQYSQFGNFLDSISTQDGRKIGKQIAKEITKGLEEGLKDTRSLKNALDNVGNEFTKSLQNLKDKSGVAFDIEKLKGYQKYLKDIAEDKRRLTSIEKALNEEQQKANPDAQKLIDLEKQRVEASNKAVELANSQKLIAQQLVLEEQKRIANSKLINAQNEKERKAAEDNLKNLQQKSNAVSDNLENIVQDLKEETQEVSNVLDEASEKLKKGGKTFKESIESVRSSISSVAASFNSIMGAMNIGSQIDRWSMSLDKYTSQSIMMGNAFGTGYAGSGSFESLKNALYDAMNDSGFIYNQEQQLALMKDLTGFSFANNQTAVKMASDLAFAKEYMGQSTESLQSMYALQVRTGQDDFLKRSLNTIAALQRTGNSLSEAQLEAYSNQSMTLTQKLMNMGMSGTAASQAYSQIMAMSVAADQVYGKGMGQQLTDMISNSLSLDALGGIGLASPDAAIRRLQQGDVQGYLDAIMNSQSARASAASISNMGGLNGVAMGSENVFGGTLNDNLIRQLAGDSNKAEEFRRTLNQKLEDIANNTDALDESKNEVANVESDYYKNANKLATSMAELNWKDIGNSIARSEWWEKLTNSILSKMDAIIAVVSLTNMFGGKIGDKILSKGIGKGLIGSAGVAAGGYALYNMGKDAFSVYTNGWTDSNGNIINTGNVGFGDSMAAAFSNSDLNASQGSNALSGGLKGAGLGAAIGSFIAPGLGTVIGGAIGAGVGTLGGLIAGGYKERKRAEALALAEQKKANEILTKTSNNVESIKNSRDVALTNRYDDGRFTGVGGETTYSASANLSMAVGGMDTKDYKYPVTSPYKKERTLPDGTKDSHSGVDLGFPNKTPVGAAIGGVVKVSKTGYNQGMGQYVEILGDDGLYYRYQHLHERSVEAGDRVFAGQQVGLSGGSASDPPSVRGKSFGAHLHFGVLDKNHHIISPYDHVTSYLWDVQSAPPSSTYSSSLDSSSGALIYNSKEGQAYSVSALPSFYGGEDRVGGESGSVYDSSGIIRGLETINNTLIAIDKRQSDQQKILDALVQTPIYDLGV